MQETQKDAIRILDNAYQVVMSLIVDDNNEETLDKIQDILSSIDEIQNKIKYI